MSSIPVQLPATKAGAVATPAQPGAAPDAGDSPAGFLLALALQAGPAPTATPVEGGAPAPAQTEGASETALPAQGDAATALALALPALVTAEAAAPPPLPLPVVPAAQDTSKATTAEPQPSSGAIASVASAAERRTAPTAAEPQAATFGEQSSTPVEPAPIAGPAPTANELPAATPGATLAPAPAAPAALAETTATAPSAAQITAAAPAQTSATAAVERPAAAQPAAPAAPTAQLHEVPQQTVETIRIAVRNDQSDARIVLNPPELGEIHIHLRHEPAGVTATVLVDAVAAREALTDAMPELRAALEAQGVNVQSLDIRESDDGLLAGRRDRDDETRSESDRDRTGSGPDDDPENDSQARRHAAQRLYAGNGLVDVLA